VDIQRIGLIKALSDFIDAESLAHIILDEMAAANIEPTFENASKIWLDVVDALHDDLIMQCKFTIKEEGIETGTK